MTMAKLILLILVASFIYISMQRLFAQGSAVPWKMLWLVLMAPPAIIVISELLGYELPIVLVSLLFLASYLTFVLMFRDRISAASKHDDHSESEASSSPTPSTQLSPASSEATSDETSSASPASDVLSSVLTTLPIADVPKDRLRSCFPWSIFYLQKVEYRNQAIICRGNLRVDPTEAYDCIQTNVQTQFGDRFLVVLQEGLAGKPFFALVPNTARRSTVSTPDNPYLALTLLLCTLLTTMSAGAVASGVNPSHLAFPGLLTHWLDLGYGIPYTVGMVAILSAHEGARYWVARRHHINLSIPYFIPLPFALGTFGAVSQLREPVPNRKVLFDLGVAGPLAGSIMSLLMLVIGLTLSAEIPAPLTEPGEALLPIINYEMDPSASFLLGILAKAIMGSGLSPDHFIHLHPLAFAGWVGFVVISFNLMPIGQLDGGHIVHAVYGQQMGANVGLVARGLVLLLAWQIQQWLFVWFFLLILMANGDEPALNDVTELDETRDLLGLFSMSLLAAIILPIPSFLQAMIGLT